MDVIFCVDRKVLPGLHVTAFSVLANYTGSEGALRFHIFTNDLLAEDVRLLEQTLSPLRRPFALEIHEIQEAVFAKYPDLHGSHATYFRLLACPQIDSRRFLYLDVDLVCLLDVTELLHVPLRGAPAGFVSEGPIKANADWALAEFLGQQAIGDYFNAGVMVADSTVWRRNRVSERCLEYLANGGPALRWDQSALNFVLHRNWAPLDEKFNFIANGRARWPSLKTESGRQGKILHFLDHPKPWDFLGELVHPQYEIWRGVLKETALKGFRSWYAPPYGWLPRTRQAWLGYKKAVKDRILFLGYSRDIITRVKGVPSVVRD